MTNGAIVPLERRRARPFLRRLCGTIALCSGVLITASTTAPYYDRTEAPVASHRGSDGSTLRVRNVVVVLPGPYTLVQATPAEDDGWDAPWQGTPVVTVLNEGSEPVVFRTARVRVALAYAVYCDPDPVEHSIGPGERRSVQLCLRPSDEAPVPSARDGWRDVYRGSFRFGELVFPDGTVHPIEGAIVDVERGELAASSASNEGR